MTVRESYNFGVDTKAKQLYTETTNQGETMVEKRFTLRYENADEWDNIIEDNGSVLTDGEVVELLNAQHEDIEKLRSRFKRVLDNSQSCHKYFDLLEQIIDEICNDDISNQIWAEYEKREKMVE